MGDNFFGKSGMPVGLCNAPFESGDGVRMRIGIPHKGGRLTSHAFNQNYPVMVSANAFWDSKTETFKVPQYTNLTELDLAVDSAGYTAMRLWQAKGPQKGMAGIFPWGYEAYIQFATSVGASWWAQPDASCEPEISQNDEEVDFRIRATATLLEGVLQVLYAWQNQLARTCNARVVANMLPPPVPVIQGWKPEHYLRSLELLDAVWSRWEPWLAKPALIGVGSVCRRSVSHPKHGLLAVLAALEGQLPEGARIHLFGVKGTVLAHLRNTAWIASADSMAFDVGARRKAWQAGRSNTMEHRSAEMTRWMATATTSLKPTPGDQSRLPFF